MTGLKIKNFVRVYWSELTTILVMFITKLYFLNLPFYWDERATQIYNVLENSYTYSLKQLAIDPMYFFNHPPCMPLFMGTITKIFGFSPFIVHFSFLLLSITALICIQKVFQEILSNKLSSLLMTLSIFVTPIYFTQSSLAYHDSFMCSLYLIGTFALYKNKDLLLALICFCLALTKHSTLSFLLPVFIYYLLYKKSYKSFKFYIASLLILAAFLSTFVINKIVFDKWIVHTAIDHFKLSITQLFNYLTPIMRYVFRKEGRIVITTLAVVALFFSSKEIIKKVFKDKYFQFIIIIICTNIGGHAFSAGWQDYYLTSAVAFTILAFFYLLKANSRLLLFSSLFFVSVTTGALYHHITFNQIPLTTSYKYAGIVKMYAKAIKYIEDNKLKGIITAWPLADQLQYKALSYIDNPLDTQDFMKPLGHILPTHELDHKMDFPKKVFDYAKYIFITNAMSWRKVMVIDHNFKLNKLKLIFESKYEKNFVRIYKVN